MKTKTNITPASWRPNPLLLAATLLSGAIALLVAPSASTELAWGLGGLAATLMLAGVGELVEGRVRVHFEQRIAELPEELAPGECRLLAAVTYDGDTATILDFAGDGAQQEIDAAMTVFVEDLHLDAPDGRGLHVWFGNIHYPPDDGTADGYEPEWLGTWRRATPAEVQRYAAGLPVWTA